MHQLSHHVKDDGARWAIVFGGDRYIIIYVSYHRRDGRPVFCVSDILRFSENDLYDAGPVPDSDRAFPLWIAMLYMLLMEEGTQEGAQDTAGKLWDLFGLENTQEDSIPAQPMGSFFHEDCQSSGIAQVSTILVFSAHISANGTP